ncbi:hypothetical protein IMY05_018G0121100 [Salix suchowensis]|nr:hypothetical protein IMY05_018G0121100 [Salix suchowensis]
MPASAWRKGFDGCGSCSVTPDLCSKKTKYTTSSAGVGNRFPEGLPKLNPVKVECCCLSWFYQFAGREN